MAVQEFGKRLARDTQPLKDVRFQLVFLFTILLFMLKNLRACGRTEQLLGRVSMGDTQILMKFDKPPDGNI
jgi:hypothetical protein